MADTLVTNLSPTFTCPSSCFQACSLLPPHIEDAKKAARPIEVLSASVIPNPTASNLVVRFSLPDRGMASLTVADQAGREILRSTVGVGQDGQVAFNVDAAQWPSGNYYYLIKAGGDVRSAGYFTVSH
jgi:hypothetical protein